MERLLLSSIVLVFIIFKVNGQTIDEMISNSMNDISGFDLVSDEKSETLRMELDILIPMKEYVEMQKERMEEDKKGRKKRKAKTRLRTRWPNGEVPYEISLEICEFFLLHKTSGRSGAINEWNENTCLNFRPAKSSDQNRIRYVNGNGCSSFVGMIGGTQNINLARGCRFSRIVTHQMGHAISFWHEQSRPDRNSFVEILEQNILVPNLFNFDRHPTTVAQDLGVPYDYLSVMHYGARAFTSNGQITVRTVDARFQKLIGISPGLSFRDIKLANLMYNCNSSCTPVQCPEEGFQASDCNCRCPTNDRNNPIQVCSSTGGGTMAPTTARPVTTTATTGSCIDSRSQCSRWAELGFCRGRFEGFMSRNCRESCNLCNVEPEACVDVGRFCDFWQSRGYCNVTFVAYMRRNCARTCGTCTPSQSQGQNNQPGNDVDSIKHSIYILICTILMAVGAQQKM